MNPALSIVVFTVVAGYAQGLAVVLALALLGGAMPVGFARDGLFVAELLLAVALGSSFLHLGQKLRAWRAVLMWRTSWMSREVIVMPALMASVFAWWWNPGSIALAVLTLLLSLALWYCTAMIYACLRFVQEWAHPLTTVNFILIGLASGLVLAGSLATALGQAAFASALALPALLATAAAGGARYASLARNRRLRPLSTLQSATGLRAPQLRQLTMGMTGGSFNTREFFHRATDAGIRRVRGAFLALGFVVPALLLVGVTAGAPAAWLAALPLQLAGLLMERWFFFAEARHPQNLYYQRVA